MKRVSIIILHYKNWPDTRACLGSLKKLKKAEFTVQVIVVNNSGEKEIESLVNRTYPSAIILQPKRNLGFAGGNNLGIKRALKDGADFIMLLNNDTVVGPTLVKELTVALEKESQAAIAGPVIKHQTKQGIRFDYGGVIDWLLGRTYHLNRVDNRDKVVRQRAFVSGCCLMIKRQVIDKIGGLDEGYFLYLEDVDFCLRAHEAGYRILHVPQAKIFHKGSQSVSRWNNLKYNWISSLRFAVTRIPWPFKPIALLYQFVFHSLLALRYGLRAIT
jgi:hypothetical protein